MIRIQTDRAPAAIGPYSQAVVEGSLLYTSGQIPLSPLDGSLIGSTVAEQTEAAIANLNEVLIAGGSALDQVIKTTCYVRDMAAFAEFNEVYARHFTSCPARSCVEVSALPKGALVEIEAVAKLKKRK
ncbi:MAG: Rid family detoxifying hydrolase [Coriobacteriaceae bacterium]|jgi:2-iminobutanoate/2-iminopropanoate deaminase|nr:Rid family detoxifying hydrolase [Coriobacteriaceae bacterium]